MRISELFVSLGFQVQGQQQLVDVDRSLTKATGTATALLAGVTALNVAFYAMITTATEAAVALGKFVAVTGESAENLQFLQSDAAKFSVSGHEVAETLEAINKAQADIKLGQGNIAPFQFFGLSVNQSAFDTLRKFAEVSRGMDVGIARVMAAQMGISENVFQWLRQSNLQLDQFNKNLLLTNAQQKNLVALNQTWQTILFSLSALKNRFAETFAEPLRKAADVLKVVIDMLADFVDWLGKGSAGANAMRSALFAGVVVMGAAFLALTALVSVLGAAALAMKAFVLASSPVLAALAPIVLVVGVLAGALVALVLLIDDFWGAVEGKESLFDWNDGLILTIKNVERLAEAMTGLMDIAKDVGNFFKHGAGAYFGFDTFSTDGLARPNVGRGGGNVTVSPVVNLKVQDQGDPVSFAAAIGKTVGEAVAQASGQLTPPLY